MLRRRPDLPRHMPGGIGNPLGARAIYIGGTLYRIHGSNEPDTIGQAVSSGCIRMTNNDVIDLYDRVHVGAEGRSSSAEAAFRAFRILRLIQSAFSGGGASWPCNRLDLAIVALSFRRRNRLCWSKQDEAQAQKFDVPVRRRLPVYRRDLRASAAWARRSRRRAFRRASRWSSAKPNYKTGPLSSAANDAGLIADTLQRAGFDVAGAADLDQDGLRKALREFVDKAAAAGPDAIAFVYISGRGVQYAGENYIAPIEAAIPRAANVPLEAVRLSDYLQPLAQLPLKARIVVLDAARINTFAQTGEPLAGGLALVEPAPGGLYAFNAAPGSVAPNETGAYGVYAQALAEALRQPGLPIDEAFAQTRLRVSEVTKGAVIPWDESKLAAGAPALFARAPDAPPPVAEATMTRLQARPIREYPVEDAFAATLERDTIQGYIDFLAVYPDSPYAPRVRAMLALRREAITWRRAYLANSPERLLELSARLSARPARLGRPKAPRHAQRAAGAAGAIRRGRIRRAAAAA